MNAKMRTQLLFTICCIMVMAILVVCGGCKGKDNNAPPPAPPATVYSNATLTGTWMIKLNTGVDIVTNGLKFDGNGNIVEMEVADNPLSPSTFPSPYVVQSNGSFALTCTFSSAQTMTFTGTLTSLTAGSVTAVDGSPVTGYLRKVTDLGACQGTWIGTLAGSFTDTFTITVDNTGTITDGSGFTAPYTGKLFCESGDATGSLGTGSTPPLDWIKFQTGTIVTGASVTISGNYETNGGNGTYTLVTPPPTTAYSNATLTGTWIGKYTVPPDTVYNAYKFDGNGNMVENYDLNPGTLPSPYSVLSNGSFTFIQTFSNGPSATATGTLTSATTGVVTDLSGTIVGSLEKVRDIGACQGTWKGTLAGAFANSFMITVDNTGTITGGSGFTAPYSGKLFCESGDATGYLATDDSFPLDRIKFQTGTVVTGATDTINGSYETNSGNGTYKLFGKIPPSGSLDTSFGNNGKVITDFGNRFDWAFAVAIQTDGKIVAAGTSQTNVLDTDFALVRYNTNGSLDTSFGTSGKVLTDFGNSPDSAYAIAIQTNGKIVAVGYSANSGGNPDFALVRYNTDGSLDTSFGTNGKVITDFQASSDLASAVTIQTDGKIVVAGYTQTSGGIGDPNFALARYNTNGSLDTSFGANGKVITDFGTNSNEWASAVAIQTDGKIVVLGSIQDSSGRYDIALARYDTIGSLDANFGTNGKVITDFGGDDSAQAIAIQTDGKIVTAGSSLTGTVGPEFILAQYNTNGSLDTSFGNNGKVITDLGTTTDGASAIAIQTDGKILAAGVASSSGITDFALARYNTNGSLDTSFGNNGKVLTDFGNSPDSAYAIAIQTNGKIVAAGSSANSGGNPDFALVRYFP